MRRLLWILVALALAACGETKIDSAKLQSEIEDDAAGEGLVLDAVDCPSPKVKEGERFSCTVTVKGEERELEVTQRNDDGNVEYSLTPLLESESGSDAGGDQASVRFVIEAVNRDVTALCDYATPAFRREIARRYDVPTCARGIRQEDDDPIEPDEIIVAGDTARVIGSHTEGRRVVTLERQEDGSWLIASVR